MPRDHARINLGIWNDDDWLDLPPLAQHLYFVLWTHPALSYAGVVAWNPAHLATRAGGWTPEDVTLAGKCLESRLFIVVDENTSECLVRSWVRWDGLMKQPIMAVSFANARAAVASREIRSVIVHEMQKLHRIDPTLAGWGKPQVQELLSARALDPRERDLPEDPLTRDLTPALTPTATVNPGVGVNPSANPSPTPSPSPATQERVPRERGTRIPDRFAVTEAMKAWAQEHTPGLDVAQATEEFADYWRGVPGAKGVKLDWVATWRNDMRRKDRLGMSRQSTVPAPATSNWDNLPTAAEIRAQRKAGDA